MYTISVVAVAVAIITADATVFSAVQIEIVKFIVDVVSCVLLRFHGMLLVEMRSTSLITKM